MRWNSSRCEELRRVERRNGRPGAAHSVRSTRTRLSQRDKHHLGLLGLRCIEN